MALGQFAREYLTVRHAEGWGSERADYYRALPYRDLSGRFEEIWRIRARSYSTFVGKVLRGLEGSEPLTVVDLGAGNGWLSHRLALRGHRAIAVDILDDALDGLGALRHYARDEAGSMGERLGRTPNALGWVNGDRAGADHDHVQGGVRADRNDDGLEDAGGAAEGRDVTPAVYRGEVEDRVVAGTVFRGRVEPLLAEFDRLPLPDDLADLVIFNASLHYSTDYSRTLAESLRVLRRRGTLVILDSPMYSDPSSGARMVQEREARFQRTYGFASNALDCEHFLTSQRLNEVSRKLGIRWQLHLPRLDARIALSRTVNGLRARREPARFPVIVGHGA